MRNHLIATFLWVMIAYSASLGRASSTAEVEDIVSLAIRENPELGAARMVIAEAEARTLTTGRLTNLELSGEVAGGQDSEGRVALGIMQRFPLTGRLRFERELSALELETARLEVKDRECQLGVAVRHAFYELVSVRATIALATRQIELAASFAKTLANGVGEGFGSSLDVQQAQLAADIVQTQSRSLRSDEVAALAKLNSLIGRPADSSLFTPSTLDFPKTVPADRPLGERADLQLAELAVRAGAVQVSLARANRWEDIGVGVFVEGERFSDEPEGIEPEALVGIQFNIPLPLWQNGSGKVAEMEATRARRERAADALRFAARNEVLAAHAILTTRHRAALTIESELIPSAARHVADTEAAYARGEVEIDSVFQARERLAEIQRIALATRQNYFIAHSEWIGALGEISTQP